MRDYSRAELALLKNAAAAEEVSARVSPLRRRPPLAEVAPGARVSEDVRSGYADEFEERASVHAYEGLPERCDSRLINPDCCAQHAALVELGCVEFYDFLNAAPADNGDAGALPAWAAEVNRKYYARQRGEIVYPGIRAEVARWSEMPAREAAATPPRAPRFAAPVAVAVAPGEFCPVCESINHTSTDEAPCPLAFRDERGRVHVGDDVRKIAEARRARRRERAA